VKQPLVIPLAMGLIGPDGAELPTRLAGEAAAQTGTRVLVLAAARQSFRFVDVAAAPVPSLLRRFSAPVKLKSVPLAQRKFLALHDSEPFARWESAQQVASQLLLDMVASARQGASLALDPDLIEMFRRTLGESAADPAFAAEMLALPSEAYLADQLAVIDVDAIHAVHRFARTAIGTALAAELDQRYERLADPGPYRIDGEAIGRRALRNACLAYLAAGASDAAVARAKAQFDAAGNMTDSLAALAVLTELDRPERDEALARFYAAWEPEGLVVDKWFSLQAQSSLPDTLDRVKRLTRHSAFELRNPNRVRALIGAFAHSNQVRFHAASGAGYDFLAEHVMTLDPINPTMASRLVQPLGTWRRHEPGRQALMKSALQRILALPGLSKNTYEMASKSLV
jgi:aminopeptidase N